MSSGSGYSRELTKRNQEITDAFNMYKHGAECMRCGEDHPAALMFYDARNNAKVSITYAKRRWRSGEEAFARLRQCECYCSNCFAKEYERTDTRARGFRSWIANYKREHGCVQCDEKDPDCLEFHHKDPSKKKLNISECRSKRSAQKEMEKCEILCLKCHDALHWEEDKSIN